jgi:tripartite-type tricarboxylate transporter receptor subunit TctC
MQTRRQYLKLIAGSIAAPLVLSCAWAQAYPSRPVRWIVSFPAGGSNDVVARIIGQFLSERFGQQFIVDNRAGAGGNLGMQTALSSAADGYTLAFAAPNYAINATLYETLPYNFLRDSVPVAGIMEIPNVMEVHPSVPAKTVAEFIAYAKANPGKISYASSGVGTSIHLTAEMFKATTGIEMVHVPYRGSAPAVTDMITGQVQLMFDNLPSSIEHVRSGRLRALAVTTAKRSDALPEVPTVAETIPGFEVSVWNTMVAPKGTPQHIVDTLNRAVNEILQNPRVKARLAELGGVPMPMSSVDLGKLYAVEIEKWGRVIRMGNIKPE